ncbi:MAG: heparinase II/III family protein [Candidatus Latescibacterota bacterium]
MEPETNKILSHFRKMLFFFFVSSPLFGSIPVSAALTETHPCILSTSQERETIRSRLSTEPFNGWRDQLLVRADNVLNSALAWDSTAVPKVTQAYYAKLLAGAYMFSESTHANHQNYGDEATKALSAVPNASFTSFFTSDLEISEAAVYWAEAYDMLKGEGFDFTFGETLDMEPDIRSRLAKLRDYMAKNSFTDIFSSGIAHDFTSAAYIFTDNTDNHHVKLQAAIVVLSLSILSESGSVGDLNSARTRLMDALGNMTITGENGEPSGGWAEGPNYHLYSAQQYLPALIALKNMNIFDFTTIPELVETHLWLPKIVMPDGYTPPFNDNEAVYFDPAGLLYSLHRDRTDRDALFWMWDQNGRAVTPAFLPDYLARFDNTPPLHSNPGELGWTPTGFYPESGFARFRDFWDAGSIYLQFLSKHGEAREKGQAHNHPDPNSFILHAFGNMLLLDSGYGGWAYHDSTRYARNHNLILVDGDGPQEASQGDFSGFWQANSSNATLDRFFTVTSLDYAHSVTTYPSTNSAIFERSVIFPSHRYFFLFDHIYSPDVRTYTLLLHGNGGGTSGGTFTSLDSGAIWEQDKASVRTFTVGSSPLTFSSTEMKHAVYSRSFSSHTVLEVSQKASESLFLTLLYPDRKGAVSPNIAAVNVSRGKGISLAFNDTTDYGAIRTAVSPMSLTAGNQNLTTDGQCFLARYLPQGELDHFSFFNGSFVVSGADTLIRSNKQVNLTAVYENQSAISGYIQTNTETVITLFGFYAARVTFGENEISFIPDANTVRFAVAGDGQWRVEGYLSSESLKPPENVHITDVPDDNGHQLRLTWKLSPSENEGLVDYYRIFRSRNATLTQPILFPKNVPVDSLLALESKFTVLVDSVTAGITEYLDTVYYDGIPYYYWLQAVGPRGSSSKAAASITTFVDSMPVGFSVGDPFPNPFNPSTTIKFSLPAPGKVNLIVYDIAGRKVRELILTQLPTGIHSAFWDGRDASGRPVSSGVYFARLTMGKYTAVRKMLLMK